MLYVKGGILYRSRDYYKRLSSLLLLSEGFTASMDGKDLAFTVQYITEELTGELLHQLYDEYGTDQLILTGGCALNSSSNGKILTNTPFKALHIPMSPGDDGNAICAAALAWQIHLEICESMELLTWDQKLKKVISKDLLNFQI